jgi:hypothetical protein
LDDLYNKFIHTEWKPKILKSISEKQKKYQKECDDMGAETIDEKEVNQFINVFWKQLFVHTFKQDFDLCDMPTYFRPVQLNKKKQTKPTKTKKEKRATLIRSWRDEPDNDESEEDESEGDVPNCHDYDLLHDKIYPKDKYLSQEDIYHDMENIVQKYIDSLSSDYFVTQITSFFTNDESYNLIRFENIKQKFVDLVTQQFALLTKTKRKQLVKDMKGNIVRDMCFGHDVIYENTPRYITSLYKLHILHPLSKLQIDFSSDDYYETYEYTRKREELKTQLEKCKEHHDKIMSI